MFIQYLASEGLTMAKLGKPRRNIQYKDLAAAVSHQDNLEFLEDIVPKTAPYKQIKAQAAAMRAQLSSGAAVATTERPGEAQKEATTNGGGGSKKHRASTSRSSLNGSFVGASGARIMSDDDGSVDPTDQLHNEMRQANGHDDDDVQMTG